MPTDGKFKYTRNLCRQYPGLFVILLDQSGSMSQPVEGGDAFRFTKTIASNNQQYTKAVVATAAINTITFEIIRAAGIDEYTSTRKKSAYLTVLGYNDTVYPLLSKSSGSDDPVDVATLEKTRKGLMPVKRVIRAPEGMREISENRPYWITEHADGQTRMALAFQRAKAIVDRWLVSRPEWIDELHIAQAPRRECFPPVIFHITDAQNNDQDDPLAVANELRSYSTVDGEVLIFNCHFTEKRGRPIIFPSSVNDVRNLDQQGLAEMMFHMSSPVPERLRTEASKIANKPVVRDTRCYVYNANPDLLIAFLRWGTIGQVGTQPGGMR